MASEVGRSAWTDVGIDAVGQASSPEALRPVRCCVIGMEPPELPIHRVGDIDAQLLKQRFLGQQGVGHRPATAENRRIAETDIKAQNTAGPDLNQQRYPGAGELLAMYAVDENHICPRMIHLHEIEQALAVIGARMRLMGAALLRAHARASPLRLGYLADQPDQSALARYLARREAELPILRDQKTMNFPGCQGRSGRWLCQEYFLGKPVDRLPHRLGDAMTANPGTARGWSQARRHRICAKSAY